jgi:hypothetical protein
VALTHYPVKDKNGDTIASAVTNLDLHDIARAAKTYGVKSFYVITPIIDQKKLIERIVAHWSTGMGARYNPKRCEALALIKIKGSLDEVKNDMVDNGSSYPKTVVTSARQIPRSIDYERFREMLKTDNPYLLILGTAWGLSDEIVNAADYLLKPIEGGTEYNHLSVRSAASIILDRLLGKGR